VAGGIHFVTLVKRLCYYLLPHLWSSLFKSRINRPGNNWTNWRKY
jgi:hypothetical protein